MTPASGLVKFDRTPDDILYKSVKYLSGLKTADDVSLGRKFTVPSRLSGVALCKLLIYLNDCIRNPRGMIEGIPDAGDLRTRIIDVQLKGDSELFESALEARNRLETKTKTGKDLVSELLDKLSEFTSRMPDGKFESVLIQKAVYHDPSMCRDIAAICRICTIVENEYNNLKNCLWGKPLNENAAQALLFTFNKLNLEK